MPRAYGCRAVVTGLLVLLAAACGGSASEGETTGAVSSPSESSSVASEQQGSGAAAGSLSGVCPDPIVIQTDWFPEAVTGFVYQLAGPNGTIDADKGAYTAPLGETGVSVEVRTGGPFLGDQQVSAQMYQDRSILLGYINQDEQIQNFAKLPTVGVAVMLERNPQMLIYDPSQHDFQSIEDVGTAGATVLAYEGTAFVEYLIGKGIISRDQVDYSYDGAPSRFVADDGSLVVVGYATDERYTWENEVPEWGKPLAGLLVQDTGYDAYTTMLAVRPDALTDYPGCLEALVPMIQQAQVDYLADPEPVGGLLIEMSDALASFYVLTEGHNDYAVEQMRELGLVGNGDDSTLGNFDPSRVEHAIEILTPILESEGVSIPAGLTADQLVTNQFIDESIGLPE